MQKWLIVSSHKLPTASIDEVGETSNHMIYQVPKIKIGSEYIIKKGRGGGKNPWETVFERRQTCQISNWETKDVRHKTGGGKSQKKKVWISLPSVFSFFFFYTSIKVTKLNNFWLCFVFTQSTYVCTHTRRQDSTNRRLLPTTPRWAHEWKGVERAGRLRANCQTLTWAWRHTRNKPVINVGTIIRKKKWIKNWLRDQKLSSDIQDLMIAGK